MSSIFNAPLKKNYGWNSRHKGLFKMAFPLHSNFHFLLCYFFYFFLGGGRGAKIAQVEINTNLKRSGSVKAVACFSFKNSIHIFPLEAIRTCAGYLSFFWPKKCKMLMTMSDKLNSVEFRKTRVNTVWTVRQNVGSFHWYWQTSLRSSSQNHCRWGLYPVTWSRIC